MKKKLSLVLFALFSITAQAQRPYTIESQLKLKTVPSGEVTDSLVTINDQGIIRYIPRSEFGGGTQDLQAVLNTSYTVENTPIVINRTAGYFQSGYELNSPSFRTVLRDGAMQVYSYSDNFSTSYSGNGTMSINAEDINLSLSMPHVNVGNKVFPISVNGVNADSSGNIDLGSVGCGCEEPQIINYDDPSCDPESQPLILTSKNVVVNVVDYGYYNTSGFLLPPISGTQGTKIDIVFNYPSSGSSISLESDALDGDIIVGPGSSYPNNEYNLGGKIIYTVRSNGVYWIVD